MKNNNCSAVYKFTGIKNNKFITKSFLLMILIGHISTVASDSERSSSSTNNLTIKNIANAKLPIDNELKLRLLREFKNCETLKPGKLPKGISGVAIAVYLPDCLNEKISKEVLKDLMEYELRKNSIKILETADFILRFEIDAFLADDNFHYIYTQNLSLLTRSKLTVDGEKMYLVSSPIWTAPAFGIVGKNHDQQKKFNSHLSEMISRFCNKILETRED